MSLQTRWLALAIFFVGNMSAGWSAPWTLVDCLNEALTKNPRILQSQQDLFRAGGSLISAKAALYPSVNIGSTIQLSDGDVFRQQNPANPGFDSSWVVSVSMTKTLYNGGITRNQIAIANLQKSISGNQFQQSINQVIYNTRVDFYNVLVANSDIDLRQQTIDLLTKEVKRQKSLFDAGRSTKFNVIRTEVRLANEIPGLEQAKVQYEEAIYNLLNDMGHPAPGPSGALDFHVKGNLEITPYSSDVDKLIVEARRRSPELAQDETQIEISEKGLSVAKAALIPQISAYAATGWQRDTTEGSAFADNNNTAVVGLSGSWNIFDGFAAKGNAIQLKAQIKQNIIERDRLGRQIEYDVRKAILNLRQAENSYQVQQANVQKARQSIDLARSSVEAGLATQFDILQATVDLSSAENIELRSRYQYNVALADLERILYLRINGAAANIADLASQPTTDLTTSPAALAPGGKP